MANRLVAAITDAVGHSPVSSDEDYDAKVKLTISRATRAAVTDRTIAIPEEGDVESFSSKTISIVWDELNTSGVQWITSQSRRNKSKRQEVLTGLVAKELRRT